ncbi:hypothetical protein IFM89_007898 [Coptis chinensis]|uniref:DUF676 domain-containing protein n=1 Tax=Coptis chinensis TaxID=261450 RepID=A0A835LQV5_9MAGN|nr:hypothetical protein IFM89_007898 [Coptis chinensis]
MFTTFGVDVMAERLAEEVMSVINRRPKLQKISFVAHSLGGLVAKERLLVFLYLISKCKRYFHNRLKPSKLTWMATYRKQHKKDIAAEAVKTRRRATKKPYSRPIVGATLEVIQKKRTEKTEAPDATREAALR